MQQLPSDRAQAYTLEAVVAAILIFGALTFALQATTITPLTSSTTSERLETQQQTLAEDTLSTAAETDVIAPSILHWDTTDKKFLSAPSDRGYTAGGPPTELGEQLNETFLNESIAFNVYVNYRTAENDDTRTKSLVYQGQPSDNAVSASKIIVLYDTMTLSDGTARNLTSVEDDLYIKDAASSTVYNVVEIELILWRM